MTSLYLLVHIIRLPLTHQAEVVVRLGYRHGRNTERGRMYISSLGGGRSDKEGRGSWEDWRKET